MATNNPHPLEDIFNLEPGSTPSHYKVDTPAVDRAAKLVDPTTGELVARQVDAPLTELDKEERIEDLHIDGQLDTIHQTALEAYEAQQRIAQEADPKFSARNAEVAAQYLNIALNAVNSRVDAKFKRQKVRIAKAEVVKPGTVNNTAVIVADRNELLRALREKQIDATAIEAVAVQKDPESDSSV